MRASLLKWCKAAHVLPGGQYLRIGSLADFRATTNDEIRDEREGDYDIVLDFFATNLTANQISRILPGAIGFGGNTSLIKRRDKRVFIDSLHFNGLPDGSFVVSAEATYQTRGNSALVFCMTFGTFGLSSPFEGYDGVWGLAEPNFDDFANELLAAVRDFGVAELVDLRGGQIPADRVIFEVDHKLVQYVGRRHLVGEADENSISKLEDIIANCEFYKPVRYAKEMEYRFVIRASYNNRYLKFLRTDLLLDARRFGRFVI